MASFPSFAPLPFPFLRSRVARHDPAARVAAPPAAIAAVALLLLLLLPALTLLRFKDPRDSQFVAATGRC